MAKNEKNAGRWTAKNLRDAERGHRARLAAVRAILDVETQLGGTARLVDALFPAQAAKRLRAAARECAAIAKRIDRDRATLLLY